MGLKVSKEQARNFLLKKQLFAEKPKAGIEGIKHVFNKIRIIQYDPLNPCGRNPDLVLQARVNEYHPNDYYKWLYEERSGIECYDKALCIIPIADFPLTSHNRKIVSEYPEIKKLIKKRKEDFEKLLKFIEKNGPISSGDIENQEKVPGTGWYGYGDRWGKVALETLWKTGRIVIVKRINGIKYYDLPHKAYNGDYFGIDRKVEEEHILRRIGSVGIMRAAGTTDAWTGLGSTRHRSALVKTLIKSGALTEIEIEEVKTKYVISSKDKSTFNEKISLRDEMIFIAPLDTLIWDRNMIEELFNFRYRWEVYVPAAKREYGYYVLPILYKDKLVGRIEPVFQNNILLIKNLWKEEGIKWTTEMDAILEKAIDKFRKYLNAKKTHSVNVSTLDFTN